MKLEKIRKTFEKKSVEYYTGSLDFPCDLCDSNSYRNYHLNRNNQLEFVICEECLKKVKEAVK